MSWIILDTEAITSGRPFDELIELAAYKVDINDEGFAIKGNFQSLIKPIYHKKIPKRIKKLTHITEEDVKKAPTYEEVLTNFQKWSGKNATFAAWGSEDKKWIKNNCHVYSLPYQWFSGNYLDLQKAYKRIRQNALKNMNIKKGNMVSLRTAAIYEGIPFDDESAHRALEDAYHCMRIFEKIYQQI